MCAARYRICQLFESIEMKSFQISMSVFLLKSHWKVHVKIQLLFFYEIHSDQLQSRFICSSKSACYMCNLFFFLHSSFHVSWTHRKLYDKWILSDWLNILIECYREFSHIFMLLKGIIDDKILRTSKLKRKKQYHYSNESVLLSLAS